MNNTKTKEESYIGKKVLIVGHHPHTGKAGIIKSLEKTAIGYQMIRVDCDDGTSAGIFNSNNLQII